MDSALAILRIAHEHATFNDYRIRDELTAVIKAVEADMDEVGFEVSDKTKECITSLENVINEAETERRIAEPQLRIEDSEEEDVAEVAPQIDDDDVATVEDDIETKVHSKKVINVDDELDELL